MNNVFISYSHKDEIWKDRMQPHLQILEQHGHIELWDDRKIDVGDTWYNEIESAMMDAAVAVCLISADYLASDFVTKEEVPFLLGRREKEGMHLFPVLVRPCPWKVVPLIRETQMLPRAGKSISKDFKDDWDEIFAEVGERIFAIVTDPEFQPPKPTPRWEPPERMDIERLPQTGQELFGRKMELELLDSAWDTEDTNVISLVAWGGVGKSTLVNKWLERMAEDNFRGARRVFGWTFHSQGAGERVTSADLFFSEALAWFGDPDPEQGSPWDKGQRLAELVRSQKALLVLDGMEPLQSAIDVERGKIKDPALAVLLTRLARINNGLCVITTREPVSDVLRYEQKAPQVDLEQISAEAGRALLRVGGVHGNDAELEAATRNFGNHALAINLLGAYLQDIHGHHISSAANIAELDIPEEQGKHPRRIMAAYAERFGDGPEVQLLNVFGLFNRAAELGAIDCVNASPPLSGLTEHLSDLDDSTFLKTCELLRRSKLLAPQSRHRPDTLDCHPLVREHFGEQLQKTSPEAWREAHSRLYEYYKNLPEKELPDTLTEMEPLFAAVAHGCLAGMHQKAMDDVYWDRINRKNEYFSSAKLGAFGADLAALSNFFETPWTQPADGLADADQAVVLSWAGFALRALGRLREAAGPMQAGLDNYIKQEEWKNSAGSAGNLSELYLTLGEVQQAVDYARQGVDFADKSGDEFQKIASRTHLADRLNHAGEFVEAEKSFFESEKMQKKREPRYPFFYSFWNFRYCELLLYKNQYHDVIDRIIQAETWLKENGQLLDIALDKLSRGRAHFLQALSEGTDPSAQLRTGYPKAFDYLNQAVAGLREAGTQHHIPRGLLARAALFRKQENFAAAWEDLTEAQEIAERGEMGLHLADYHLEACRLCLAEGKRSEAREHLETAAEMIEKMDYGRRQSEVEELRREVGV
jgi:tetratricopeptide (TPR) repeat protein